MFIRRTQTRNRVSGEPYEDRYRVRFRVDGELREITQPPIAIK